MNSFPQSWCITHRQDDSIKIEIKRILNQSGVIFVLFLLGFCILAWPRGKDVISAVGESQIALLAIMCPLFLPVAIAYVFHTETWIVGRNSLTIQTSVFGICKTRQHVNGHLELVANEDDSGYQWALKVCSTAGDQEIFSPRLIAELEDVASFLSQHTGWPIRE